MNVERSGADSLTVWQSAVLKVPSSNFGICWRGDKEAWMMPKRPPLKGKKRRSFLQSGPVISRKKNLGKFIFGPSKLFCILEMFSEKESPRI